MPADRHLEGKGKAEFFYDYKYDTLIFKVKDRDYKTSIEFQNFVIDIDVENFVTGIRIIDVSKISGLKKIAFKNMVHGELNASIKDNVINVRFKFVVKLRNRIVPLFSETQDFVQQFAAPLSPKHHIKDSIITVPEISLA